MRLVTFAASGRERIGALIDNDRRIVDFLAAHDGAGPAFQNMQALIEGGAAALVSARKLYQNLDEAVPRRIPAMLFFQPRSVL